MRIGVFGGAFDPPHAAHAAVAAAAQRELNLDRVLWIPTAYPPHKQTPATAFEHRFGMVAALIQGCSGQEVSEVEASLPPPSYMLRTLRTLKAASGSGHAWYLIVGADQWSAFPRWHDPEAVLAEAELVVYPRNGLPLGELPPRVQALHCPEISEASQAWREQLRRHPDAVLSQLPDPVARYIRRNGLYGLNGLKPQGAA